MSYQPTPEVTVPRLRCGPSKTAALIFRRNFERGAAPSTAPHHHTSDKFVIQLANIMAERQLRPANGRSHNPTPCPSDGNAEPRELQALDRAGSSGIRGTKAGSFCSTGPIFSANSVMLRRAFSTEIPPIENCPRKSLAPVNW